MQNSLFEQGQIRLAELSVCNWGSFHGLHTAKIDPDGTLITGDNGAGKSTFIDGLMALLQPIGKATFNVAAAQGDRSDRSLLSYMRGSFGSVHDGSQTRVKSKREKAVITGLRALYRNDDGSFITLIALFWTLQATNSLSDVKRLYIVAKSNLDLKEVLAQFGEANINQLKRWLRNRSDIAYSDGIFENYQEIYRSHLAMDNKNAPALLSRALGLKKIDDLTKLIRELVLEPSNIREEARLVVEEFADLVATHNQLLDVREQVNHLQSLPAKAQNIEKYSSKKQSVEQQKAGLSVYFAEQQAVIYQQKIATLNARLSDLAYRINQQTQQIDESKTFVEQRHAEYLQLGGHQIDILKNTIAQLQKELDRMAKASSDYQEICKKLALNNELIYRTFEQNQQTAQEKSHQSELIGQQKLERLIEVGEKQKKVKDELHQLDQEIQEISSRPDSNIDIRYQQLRDRLKTELQFNAQELMFIGELIDVDEKQKVWQGAIERALGSQRMTLLVPKNRYTEVTGWLNRHHTGLFVRVQVAENSGESVSFAPNSFLTKLVFRNHHYQTWLKNHLQRSDLVCVDSVDALNRTPYSLTKEGLIHLRQGTFEKKDQTEVNDRRKWQLGFSNKSKLGLLQTQKNSLSEQLRQITAEVEQANQEIKTHQAEQQLWERLERVNWDEINVPETQAKLERNQQELQAYEQHSGDLNQAKIRWEQAKVVLNELEQQLMQLITQKGANEKELSNFQQALSKAEALIQQGLDEEIRVLLEKRIGNINLDDLLQQNRAEKALDSELNRILSLLRSEENSVVGTINSFVGKDKWKPIAADWITGLAGLDDFLRYYQTLCDEGLPELLEQFKGRLNKHTTQSLARLNAQIESEQDKIYERIKRINEVLARTEFKQNSFLRLTARKEKYAHVVEFDKKIKNALQRITSENHEERYRLLQEVVNVLDKASSSATANTLESLRLLDPRYQMAFYAEELQNGTDIILDVLDSSSGKSGGEKESFAGTIVAASLAYVLTPDNCDRPVYCTVFLDEAFSNTAESVSRRVLRVFKALHIHVNLITPFKNLNLARESARSLLIAERDIEKHESRLCEITWEELDKQQAQKQQAEMAKYGINING